MRAYVLTGAPGAGKTAILRQLEVDGYAVAEEAATDVIALHQALGRPEPWHEPGFAEEVLDLQLRRSRAAAAIPGDVTVVIDRSPICTLAWCRHMDQPPPGRLLDAIEALLADGWLTRTAFLVRLQGSVRATAARRISLEDSLAFEAIHVATYEELGFDLVEVPPGPLPDRVAIVERGVHADRAR